MGVSFKVAKAGTRYRPKPVQVEAKEIDSEPTFDCQRRGNEVYVHVNVFIYACIDISTLFVGKKSRLDRYGDLFSITGVFLWVLRFVWSVYWLYSTCSCSDRAKAEAMGFGELMIFYLDFI